MADAVVDLVETGTTMKVFDIKLALLYVYAFIIILLLIQAAGLEIVSEVLTTQALLISSKTSKHKDIVEIIRKRIVGYLTATK